MNPRLLELQRLTIALSTETDPTKRQALLDERAAVAKAELEEVRKQEIITAKLAKLRPPARYPLGLEARLGEYTATVQEARYQAGAWHYVVEISPVPILGTYTFRGTEAELKAQLAERLGVAAGPAYPVGLVLKPPSGELVIDGVTADGDTFRYQVRGRAEAVIEAQLAQELGG